MKGATLSVCDPRSDGCCCALIAPPLFFFFLLTHLIPPFWQCARPGQFCFILIAYFRLKKLVFLDYFDVEMGLGEQFTFILRFAFTTHTHMHARTRAHTQIHTLFCANSRIPIYTLAVELNYCKHLCGPARHNRLAGSCIMSVPPTGQKWDCIFSLSIQGTYGIRGCYKHNEMGS